jgi:hypothetical protein
VAAFSYSRRAKHPQRPLLPSNIPISDVAATTISAPRISFGCRVGRRRPARRFRALARPVRINIHIAKNRCSRHRTTQHFLPSISVSNCGKTALAIAVRFQSDKVISVGAFRSDSQIGFLADFLPVDARIRTRD